MKGAPDRPLVIFFLLTIRCRRRVVAAVPPRHARRPYPMRNTLSRSAERGWWLRVSKTLLPHAVTLCVHRHARRAERSDQERYSAAMTPARQEEVV